ncbi:MAG: alpha-galactosidase, partial [Gemmobacter sp.]|nr:alpha-galactosidase [Gemmobacter sp.]
MPIAYSRDMNRDLTTAGDALAALRTEVLCTRCALVSGALPTPQVEIEFQLPRCLRDMGDSPTHRVWTSDCNDAPSRVAIQRGALQFLPPEILGAHIGPAPAHTTGRSQSLNFRGWRSVERAPGHRSRR